MQKLLKIIKSMEMATIKLAKTLLFIEYKTQKFVTDTESTKI